MLQDFFFTKHLDDDETIHRVVHQHWFVGLKHLFLPTLLFAVLIWVLTIMPQKVVIYGLCIAAIATGVWWLRNFMDYYLDAWIITNKGIIDLAWHGWFHRSSARVLYSDINGVSYEINGFFGTILRYGEISVEKISTGSAITMENVKNPRIVEMLILESMETYMHTKNLKDAKTVQNILAEFVAGAMIQKDPALKPKRPVKKVEEEDDDEDDE